MTGVVAVLGTGTRGHGGHDVPSVVTATRPRRAHPG